MIPALSWLPKGAAKSVPEVAELPSKEEIEELLKSGDLEEEEEESGGSGNESEDDGNMDVEAEMQSDGVGQALAVADALGRKSKTNNLDAALEELHLEDYDDEDEDVKIFSSGLGGVYYPDNKMDPNLKDKDDDDSEEEEDMTIKSTDAVIVCARTEEELSHLEVWISEDSDNGEPNMYIHHDIILSAFPLCVAWLDCPIKGGEKGNFIAVGSMESAIELWDLDIIEEVQPSAVLGGVVDAKENKKKKKKKKGKGSIKYKEGSHTDSVLGLAWNKQFRNVLASASADKQVKIWDVATEKCSITMEHHTDKVQAIAWNHQDPQILLSGSFDRSVVMKDGRNPSHPGIRWSVTADVESLAWDPHSRHNFVVSLADGTVQGFDIRTATSAASCDLKPTYTIHAHDKEVCTIAYNPCVPNFLATGSTDKMVKVWDLSNNQPSCVASNNPKAGAVFSICFSVDSPFLMAIGGSKGNLEVWDTLTDAGVSRRFGNYNNKMKSKTDS